jgi:WD40 repeat protein
MAYVSPDWSRLVTVTSRCATVSDLETGTERATLCGHSEEIEFSAVDASSKVLVTGSSDKVIRWDLDRAAEVSSFEGFTFDGYPGGPIPVVLSADGNVLARAVGEGRVRVWDLGSGRVRSELSGPIGAVASIAVSRSGDRLLTGSNDGIARLWDLRSGSLLRMFRTGETSRVALSPHGDLVATSGKIGGNTTDVEGSTVRLWDAESGKEVRSLDGHSATILALAFSPDGKLLATGSGDRTARVWDVGSGHELRKLADHRGEVRALAYSPDGNRLATGETFYRARIWDVESGAKLGTIDVFPESINALAFGPGGDRLFTAGEARGVRMWDMPWWTRMLERETPLRSYGEEQDDRLYFVATIAEGRVLVAATEARIELRDVSSGRLLETLDSDTSGLRSTAVSSDGKRIFMGLGTGVIQIWNVEKIAPFSTHR